MLAELSAGTASVGVRLNKGNTVHFFEMHKTPEEAATVVSRIARGEMTLEDIAEYDWRAVEIPRDYIQVDEQNSTT